MESMELMELCCRQKFEYEKTKNLNIWNKWTTRVAAKNGHLECLKYAHQNGSLWNDKTCLSAAHYGNLECLKYAHQNGCPWGTLTCTWAAHSGHLECLKYAHQNGCPWNELTCQFAARNGNLDCLKYAHQNGCPWDRLTSRAAAENGELESLKYAHQNECPWDESISEFAARNGNLECLKYAHQNKCPWDSWTCAWAVDYNITYNRIDWNLECLKYAHQNECPWDQWTCSNAVRNGNLECLKYAHQNGCPWTRFRSFTYNQNTPIYKFSECLEYLYLHSHPSCNQICMIAAGINLDFLTYWHQKLFPYIPDNQERKREEKKSYIVAIDENQFPCFKYLHLSGFKASKKIFHYLQQHRNPHLNKLLFLIYAYRNNFPGRDLYHSDLKSELLNQNLQFYYSKCLIVYKYLKKYIRKFIKRHYSPNEKGYLSSLNHFNTLLKTSGSDL